MSFSLRLRHGDLALESNALAIVEGPDKVIQDLTCSILTPLGFDELHPSFGSTLIDNLLEAGATGVLGSRDFSHAATLIHAEIVRICQQYQAQQIHRRKEDGVKFGKTTLDPEEILLGLNGVKFTQVEDRLICVVELNLGKEIIIVRVPLVQEESN